MKVLIADKFEQSGRDGLEAAGCDYSYQPDVKDDALVEAIKAYAPDALVVRSTKVSEAMLDAGALKLVVRAGAGFNTIDVAAASRPSRPDCSNLSAMRIFNRLRLSSAQNDALDKTKRAA